MNKKHRRVSSPPLTVTIETFSHDGRGIARINGKTTFIQGALSGETVTFNYIRLKKDYDEGQVISVVSPSSLRAEPRCSHYEQCGGCSLQHLNESAQIHVKETLLLDSLQRIGHVTPEQVLEPLRAASWNYRNKARLSVRFVEKKQKTLVGFREKNNPRYITEITQCAVLTHKVDEQIMALCSLIDSFETPHAIAQIEVAAGDEEVALIFRNLSPLSVLDEEKLRQFGEKTGFILFLQPGGPESVIRFYPCRANDLLHYTLPDEGIHLMFHPTDFTQVNGELNRRMVAFARQLLELNSHDVVGDLFCGLGNFSLPLARHCKAVIGVEGSEEMVRRAETNALLNHIHNTEFHAANLDDAAAVSSILQRFLHLDVTKILIDPPRSGALEVVRQINTIKPSKLVYVSCNPATLARDSDVLVNQHGYRLKEAGVMDMFPHTQHVESIALFEKV